MKNYEELNIIKNVKSICLISHIEPDPDAISSLVILKEFLEQHFSIPNVDIFAEYSTLSEQLQEILGANILNKPDVKNYDVAIMLDCPNSDRLGKFKPMFDKADLKIAIDHHATNNFCCQINIVEFCSSTCEIIYALTNFFNYNLTAQQKGKLYAGIITDTNNFTVGQVSSRTFSIISQIAL